MNPSDNTCPTSVFELWVGGTPPSVEIDAGHGPVKDRTESMNRFRTAGAAALAFAACVSFTTAASAATPPAPNAAQSVDADVASSAFTIQVHATRAANSPANSATGTFTAHTSLGSLNLLTLRGPVTCLDVRGNKDGLFYPIQSSAPAVLSKLGSGVFIYFDVSSTGKATMIGFVPVPISHTNSCAPSLALLPATSGSVHLTS